MKSDNEANEVFYKTVHPFENENHRPEAKSKAECT